MEVRKKLRIAMPAWEIGRVKSGLGVKIGGLGVIVEELPPELVKAAAQMEVELEVETLSPCFAHYDRGRMTKLDLEIPVILDGQRFNFEVYKHTFPDGQTVVYFWDEWQLGWTNERAIYPDDPNLSFRLFATVSQAMAGYIRLGNFDTVHSHDYHVGLIPFYLGDEYLQHVPHHFTIHNATYQGNVWAGGNGYEKLWSVNLNGAWLFHKYFDHWDNLSIMKATLIKTHEMGGKITTVSGDLQGSWGYAAELREPEWRLYQQAQAQKGWYPVGEVFVPNRGLNIFEQLPIIGITNGMSEQNRADQLPELSAAVLREMQAKRATPLFNNPIVQEAMLAEDHHFDTESLETKAELKRLLHLEAFGSEPAFDPVLITAVGRLVSQKNLGLVADIIERTLDYDPGTKFVILASAPDGESAGKAAESHFFYLAHKYPDRVYFNNGFNLPLSKLILAGGDFSLIPSRFEPCGLVDYEASLVGNVVVGRRTGGLAKVDHCAYLYDWLDVSDYWGEANAFFEQLRQAVDVYRHDKERHAYLMKTAMSLHTSWAKPAREYVEMYQYGLLMREWWAEKSKAKPDVAGFAAEVQELAPFFADFFSPVWGGELDYRLAEQLK
ncbi:MAG: glycogen/starch synthase [Anaerolineales bacterium]|nr:glycogen/starch synthase [Anaerolineales bacterium]